METADVTPAPRKRAGRLRALRRAPTQALRTEFLIQAAALAVQRWDGLTLDEQERFRQLAPRAAGGLDALIKAERLELSEIWRKLEARGLIRELIALLGREPAGAGKPEDPRAGGSPPA